MLKYWQSLCIHWGSRRRQVGVRSRREGRNHDTWSLSYFLLPRGAQYHRSHWVNRRHHLLHQNPLFPLSWVYQRVRYSEDIFFSMLFLSLLLLFCSSPRTEDCVGFECLLTIPWWIFPNPGNYSIPLALRWANQTLPELVKCERRGLIPRHYEVAKS